jgi:hypothetical protein
LLRRGTASAMIEKPQNWFTNRWGGALQRVSQMPRRAFQRQGKPGRPGSREKKEEIQKIRPRRKKRRGLNPLQTGKVSTGVKT